MGGTAALATAAVAAKSLFDQHQANKSATKKLTDSKIQNAIERKKALNLLDEDMAARRAKLSKNGVLSSNSSTAYLTRNRKNAYDSINGTELKYAAKNRDTTDDYKQRTFDIWSSAADTLLK